MSLGLVGRKVGMTRIFTDDGDTIPVTVLDVSNNRVTQVKTPKPTATPPCRWRSAHAAHRVCSSRRGPLCQGGCRSRSGCCASFRCRRKSLQS